jgi:site-specific recombinase XerD
MKNRELDRHIGNYLLWIIDRNLSKRTIDSHEGMLKYFKAFVDKKGLDPEQAVQPETANAFLAECELTKAPPAVNGFMRYLESKHITTGFTKTKMPPPMDKDFEDYMRHVQRTKNPGRSIKTVRKVLSDFNDFMRQHGLAAGSLEINWIDRFLGNYSKNFSPSHGSWSRSVIRGFLKYLYHERGILKRDLGSMLVSAPVFARHNPPKYYRPCEIRRLFECMTHDSPRQLRANAVVWLAYATGIRPGEIIRVTLDDIVFTRSELTLAVRKGGNPVVFPLPEETLKAISAYMIGARPETGHRELFVGLDPPHCPISRYVVKRILTDAIRRACLPGSPYWLRHTYAQNLLESGASLFEIKEMLGHDDIKSTKRYLHIHVRLMREVLFDEFEDNVQQLSDGVF